MADKLSLGFIGTLRALGVSRNVTLGSAILHFRPTEFHFGDEIGSDGHAYIEVRKFLPECLIYAHPSTREWSCAWRYVNVRHKPLDPINCWKAIVRASDVVIVAPAIDTYQPRSFTWPAVLFAVRKHKEVYVITTNGRAKRYRFGSDRQAEGLRFAFPG